MMLPLLILPEVRCVDVGAKGKIGKAGEAQGKFSHYQPFMSLVEYILVIGDISAPRYIRALSGKML